jgi:hypothetical protein
MPTWPSATKASTANVDAGTDQISLARADIKQNIDNVNDIIDTLNIGSPTNGDLMQYSSSTSKWEKVSATSVGQTAQLIIPFTGWVVSEAAADSNTSSAGAEARKFRQALLGGAYYLRGPSTAPALTAAADTYGTITGASVTRATPTLVEPTGYSFSISGGNYAGNITNGVLNSTGPFSFTTNVGSGSGSSSGRCWYATGYDNYVTLPTGTYTVEIRTANTSSSAWTNTHTYHSGLNSDNDTIDNMSVYNRTDNVMITPQNEAGFTPSDTQLNPAAWPVNSMAVFTLSGTKNIQFVNRVNPNTIDTATDDALGIKTINLENFTSGDLTPQSSGSTWHFFKNSAYIPAKLGWVTLVPNTWIVITKLS